MHPLELMIGIGLITAITAGVVAIRTQSRLVAGIMLLVALVSLAPSAYVVLAIFPELADARFRTYKGFYRDIHVGMTREQVLAAMERRYPKSGKRQPPRILENATNRLGFFMNPEKSVEPNCEGIFLNLESNRVVSKVYSAD
jgi:hypothetical protein